MGLAIGCIADDFTGATDLANNFVRGGLAVVQTIGVPTEADEADEVADVIVVALKSRTVPAQQAVEQSLEALAWLRARHAARIYFKVCSTFDSTPAGNIGPVADALADSLGAGIVPVTPAFPDNARTVFNGHLFVGEMLLSDSGMRNHPLTPMTDANLVRVLGSQTRAKVGLVSHRDIAHGAAAVTARMATLEAEGARYAILDAVSNDDLVTLGAACVDRPLTVAGSGLAVGLAAALGPRPQHAAADVLPPMRGAAAIVSGSCSEATRRQVARFVGRGGAAVAIDTRALSGDAEAEVRCVLDAALAHLATADGPVLIYSTAAPDEVRAAQTAFGGARTAGESAAGAAIERALARIARALVEQGGVRRLIVAGGETSGACVQALGVSRLRIGPQIDPGVPWCHAARTSAGVALHLALKSGNFGADDFFHRAFEAPAGASSTP